jgi:hypothetical protein
MSAKFMTLRIATRNSMEQLGASRNEELFEFRNAATFTFIHELFREYDRAREQAAAPVATSSFGTLTQAEAALLQAYRQADDDSKITIQIAAEVSLQVADEFASKDRCDVVDIASARPHKT